MKYDWSRSGFFHYAYTTLDYYELSFVYFWGIAI